MSESTTLLGKGYAPKLNRNTLAAGLLCGEWEIDHRDYDTKSDVYDAFDDLMIVLAYDVDYLEKFGKEKGQFRVRKPFYVVVNVDESLTYHFACKHIDTTRTPHSQSVKTIYNNSNRVVINYTMYGTVWLTGREYMSTEYELHDEEIIK